MERKVGEIFEYNGEWYQCIHTKSLGCENCDLATKSDIHCSDVFEIRGECLSCYRKDGKSVIFKKLKKVGEPEIINGKKVQSIVTGYVGCAFCIFKKGGACLSGGTCKNRGTRTIYVEVKQNKENMEEKKLNLKPFDLEAAKAGKPVCTRDGRKARIICFDTINKGNYPIIALLEDKGCEAIFYYNKDGKCNIEHESVNIDSMDGEGLSLKYNIKSLPTLLVTDDEGNLLRKLSGMVPKVTGFINDWKHFFELRCAPNAHPSARELAIPLSEEFVKKGLV